MSQIGMSRSEIWWLENLTEQSKTGSMLLNKNSEG